MNEETLNKVKAIFAASCPKLDVGTECYCENDPTTYIVDDVDKHWDDWHGRTAYRFYIYPKGKTIDDGFWVDRENISVFPWGDSSQKDAEEAFWKEVEPQNE